MTVLMLPPLDAAPWPTLGLQLGAWIEDCLVHGPGDIRGEPARLDAEKLALLCRLYEVYPPDHPQAGRRRFKRAGLSLRKGTAKTELAAWVAAAELHPEAPVRCDGFDAAGQPVGIGVTDPYIPLVAYTEEQSDELAFSALYVCLSEGPLADDFDIGLERITRINGDGRAVSLAGAPDARDGARTTFQVFDETHRMSLPRLLAAHQTMLANTPKRKGSDPWSLELTTAFVPGEGSVAERTWDYAQDVAAGEIKDPRLFFFHRQASESHDITTKKGLRAAVEEASGPSAEWSDLDGIMALAEDPTTDPAYFERVWLNRPRQGSWQAFDVAAWQSLERTYAAPDHAVITLGFDGSMYNDATALVAVEVSTGHIWPVRVWEPKGRDWKVPRDEVDAAVEDTFGRYSVWRLYADPAYWESNIAAWQGRFGDKHVVEWDTRRRQAACYACRSFASAIESGELTHSGSDVLERHLGNAHRAETNMRDPETGERLWMIRKERKDSPNKIDAAMAAILGWEARTDAVAAGVGQVRAMELQII